MAAWGFEYIVVDMSDVHDLFGGLCCVGCVWTGVRKVVVAGLLL